MGLSLLRPAPGVSAPVIFHGRRSPTRPEPLGDRGPVPAGAHFAHQFLQIRFLLLRPPGLPCAPGVAARVRPVGAVAVGRFN